MIENEDGTLGSSFMATIPRDHTILIRNYQNEGVLVNYFHHSNNNWEPESNTIRSDIKLYYRISS